VSRPLSSDQLFDHERRLERAYAVARFTGAPVVLLGGFAIPTLGTDLVVALVAAVLGYSVALVILTAPDRPPRSRRRVVAVAHLLDTATVIAIVVLFSPDQLWTARLMAPLLIFAGGFRFGVRGVIGSTVAMIVTLAAGTAFREAAFGFVSPPLLVAVEIGMYVIAAALVIATVEELGRLRDRQADLFEPLLRAQDALGVVVIVSLGRRVEFVNRAFERLTGRRATDLARATDGIVSLFAARERAALRDRLSAARERPLLVSTIVERTDGTTIPVTLARATVGHNGDAREVTLMRDITAERRATEHLQRLADTDQLTGLPNRRRLVALMAAAIAADTGQPFALLLIDLRAFSTINETFGHETGDALLHEVGPRVTADLRAQDVLARVGADDFAILLPGGREPTALGLGRRLRASFERPFVVGERQFEVGLHVGVALYPDDGADPADLLRRAEVALGVAHRTPGAVERYRPAHDADSRDRLQLATELRGAIANEELVLHYQPARDLRTGRVGEAEALVRWQHPARGLLAPGLFIGLAEQTGLIKPLTDEVLRRALRERAALAASGYPVAVAVNLSMHNLADAELPDLVDMLLRATDTPPGALVLEITESLLMADAERTIGVLRRLRALGARLAIDDFGAGYSSLAYLDRLPIDRVKIDRSFVSALRRDARTATIVEATIALAHRLDLEVVAEGVEDATTLALLTDLGCDVAQGYHLARPMPAPALAAWLEQQPGTRADG
jgi:diguanylate cyclase (GGDEF)-like protein/PAS domain S-box-containing protein